MTNTTERDDFESWAYTENWRNFTRHDDGSYCILQLQCMHRGYKAGRAALASPATVEPVEARETWHEKADRLKKCVDYAVSGEDAANHRARLAAHLGATPSAQAAPVPVDMLPRSDWEHVAADRDRLKAFVVELYTLMGEHGWHDDHPVRHLIRAKLNLRDTHIFPAVGPATPQQPAQPDLALRSAIDQFGPERLARAIAQHVAKVKP